MLYDVSSSYFEGRCCPLAQHGYSRDHRGDRPQIVSELSVHTRRIAGRGRGVRWQHGRSGDAELAGREAQGPLRHQPRGAGGRPRHDHLGADRRETSKLPAWTGSPACGHRPFKRWRRRTGRCSCRCSTSATWPRSARPRCSPANGSLSAATANSPPNARASGRNCWPPPNASLLRIQAQVRRRTQLVRSAAEIGLAVGGVVEQPEDGQALRRGDPRWPLSPSQRRTQQIESGGSSRRHLRDPHQSVPAEQLDANEAVQAYKDLSRVERAFRSLKTVDLDIRPDPPLDRPPSVPVRSDGACYRIPTQCSWPRLARISGIAQVCESSGRLTAASRTFARSFGAVASAAAAIAATTVSRAV